MPALRQRPLKAGDTIVCFGTAWLTWGRRDEDLHGKPASAAVVLSSAWLGLTAVREEARS